MYSRNFGTQRSTPPPPPSYSGVMYPREEIPAESMPVSDPPESLQTAAELPPADPFTVGRGECREEQAESKGLLGSLFGRTLTFEDLLLIGLMIMLIDSGADDELLIILAFLLLSGR